MAYKCAACGNPRTGISREIDRTRENALCPGCYAMIGVCLCGCGNTFPLYNGHGVARRLFDSGCHSRVPAMREQASKKRSETLKRLWDTQQYRMAHIDPDKYAETPKEVREKNKCRWHKIYAANTEFYNERSRRYRREHPEMHVAQERRRYLRKRGADSRLIRREWQDILASYNHSCAYCGSQKKKLTQDHVIPLSKGGSHTMQNIVPACMHCNRLKSSGAPLVPVQPLLL